MKIYLFILITHFAILSSNTLVYFRVRNGYNVYATKISTNNITTTFRHID